MIRSAIRKAAVAALVLTTLAAVPAQAQFVGPSTSGRGGTATTVAEAAEARSDTRVILEGHIIGHQRGEYYTFKDETGTITVEIERHIFRGRTITADTKVRLHGEVERSARGRYVDVHRLEVIE